MDTDKEERTNDIGLARYSREYYDAAIAADDVIGTREGYEIIAPPPVMFLVAHAIELALKAYLRHKGLTLDQLKRVGHNLNDCWQEAVKNGIEDYVSLTGDDLHVLNIISDLHSSTELRYIQTGFKEFPVFGPLQKLSKNILDNICPLVGYK